MSSEHLKGAGTPPTDRSEMLLYLSTVVQILTLCDFCKTKPKFALHKKNANLFYFLGLWAYDGWNNLNLGKKCNEAIDKH